MKAWLAAPWKFIRRVPAKMLDDLRRDPVGGRRILLRSIWIALAFTAMVTVVLMALVLSWSLSTGDRLVALGDVLVGATLLLAAIAAVVALLAYAVSTGPPDLQIRIWFPFSAANKPEFQAHTQEGGNLQAVEFKQLSADIQIRNNSSYSAKNPAVIIKLEEMAFLREIREEDWAVINFASTNGIIAVQWDGGPAYSIHGNSTRRLPDLWLHKLHVNPGAEAPAFAIEILADGYRKEIVLPVNFTVDGAAQFPREDGQASPEWM
jgi:hypothetical protein